MNATVVTSNEPKTPPIITNTAAIAATPGSRIAGLPLVAACRPVGFGSVDRCESSSTVPTTSMVVASSSPALGLICSATMVASGGPRMNTASSTSDSQANAVRSNEVPCSCTDQRARTSGPTIGWEAPATNASRKTGQVSDVHRVMAIIPSSAGTCTSSWIGTTLDGPNESISRLTCGPMTALDSA